MTTLSDMLPLIKADDGAIRVGNTRITLDVIVHWYNAGATAEEIASYYPTLDVSDVYYAIGYYLHNRLEVAAYFAARTETATEAREYSQRRAPNTGLKERLLLRQSGKI